MSYKTEQIQGNYFNKYGSNNIAYKKIMNTYFDTLRRMLNLISFNTVLEVGCGEGHIINFIASNFKGIRRAEGFDIGSEVIRYAKEIYPNILFQAFSLYDNPYESNSFEITVCCEVLEHLEYPDKGLEEVFRISSKYILLSVPNEPIWRICNILRGKYLMEAGNTPGHINHWSKASFIKFVKMYGIIKAVETPFPWIMILLEKNKGRELT